MIRIADKRLCCGCSACMSACPLNCIEMKYDDEGFLYPVVDQEKCVNCHACEKVCPMNCHNYTSEPKASTDSYGCQVKKIDDRMACTAGGFVSLVAETLFDEGVNVYGCLYRNMVVCHSVAKSKRDLECFRGSKYVQSDLNNVFLDIKEKIKNGEKVLFVGTPCQANGLRQFIGNTDNLYIVDLLCLGVSSPVLFSEWVNYLKAKYKTEVVDIQFRNKRYGYSVPNVRILFKNGKSIEQKYDSKVYSKLFFRYYSVRPSCYECQFREIPRVSDITVGDFSNVGEYSHKLDDDTGVTRIWIHSEKGKELFSKLSPYLSTFVVEKGINNIIGGKKRQITLPKDRWLFFEDYKSMDFASLIHKWQPPKIQDILVSIARPILNHMPFKRVVNDTLRNKRLRRFDRDVDCADMK